MKKNKKVWMKYRVHENTKKIPRGAWIFVLCVVQYRQNAGQSRPTNKYG
jgi:hypothetical protein